MLANACARHQLHQQQSTSDQQNQAIPAGKAALADFWRVRLACDVKLTVATCRSSDMMRLASSGPLTASSRSLAVSAAVLNLEYLDSSSCAYEAAIQAYGLPGYPSSLGQRCPKDLSARSSSRFTLILPSMKGHCSSPSFDTFSDVPFRNFEPLNAARS